MKKYNQNRISGRKRRPNVARKKPFILPPTDGMPEGRFSPKETAYARQAIADAEAKRIRYRVVDSIPACTVRGLRDALDKLVNESQGNTYLIDENNDYIESVQLVEMTLSDGSKVTDIRLVPHMHE